MSGKNRLGDEPKKKKTRAENSSKVEEDYNKYAKTSRNASFSLDNTKPAQKKKRIA